MPALLDALRGRMKQRELNAIDTIAEAARAAARGEGYDVTAIEHALIAARLTADDFEKAIDNARKRAGWLREFDRLASSTTRVKKVEASIQAEQTKFEAARRAFVEKGQALDADLAAARAARDAGQTAQGNLLDPRYVPGTVGEKYRAAVAEADAAKQALDEVQQTMREIDERIKSEKGWIKQLLGEDSQELKPDRVLLRQPERPQESFKVEEHRNALARAQRRKGEAEAQLVEAEKAVAIASRAVEALVPEVVRA